MRPMTKLASALFIAATISLCSAMESQVAFSDSLIKYGLEKMLDKIDEEGFFLVSEGPEGLITGERPLYTQHNDFREDKNGNFVNREGYYLQIFKTDSNGFPLAKNLSILDEMTTANSKNLQLKPQRVTTYATFDINLSAAANAGTSVPFSFIAWDSLGVSHLIDMNFTKSMAVPATWTITPATDATSSNAQAFDAVYTAGVQISFDSNGSISPHCYIPNVGIVWNNSASPSLIRMDFGQNGNGGHLTCIGNNFDIPPAFSDGSGIGKYIASIIDPKKGNLIALYDDDSKLIYGNIPVVTFEIPKLNFF